MMKQIKPTYLLLAGMVLYLISFFLPVLQVSLGVKLSGWEVMVLHFSEIAFIDTFPAYFMYLLTALVHFWIIGLLVGSLFEKHNGKLMLLSGLALISSFSWLFLFQHSSVLLFGYYVWLLSIVLIVLGRVLKKKTVQLSSEESALKAV